MTDDFDAAFLDDAAVDAGGAEDTTAGDNDDAVSVGSSSSSGSSSSDDGSVEATPPKTAGKATLAARRAALKATRAKGGKRSFFDDDSSDDESVECGGSSRGNDGQCDAGMAGVKGKASVGGNDTRKAHDDPLDADLDDDDDLAGYFSKPTHTPPPSTSAEEATARGPKERPSHEGGAGTKLAPRKDERSPFVGLDSLDDDALADLDEEDDAFGKRDARQPAQEDARPDEADASASSKAKRPRGYAITYNGEKRETPPPEEVVDSSDDEDEEEKPLAKVSRRGTDKENGSPNKPKAKSSYFDKGSKTTEAEDECGSELDGSGDGGLDPLEEGSPQREAPGSPSSLDTPREEAGGDDLAAVVEEEAKEEEATETKEMTVPRAANPYRNPYQKQQKRRQEQKQLEQNDVLRQQAGMEKQRGDVESSVPIVDTSTADAPTSGVIALPDMGISPHAQQTELERLGVLHDHYKPPPHASGPDPIVHNLDGRSRPKHSRRNVAVDQVFSPPVSHLWRSKFAKFNHVQSEMANVLAHSDDNVIVSAPTGAGKTALFEMALARMFASDLASRGGAGCVARAKKAVYLAPNKALCEERRADWSERLRHVDPGLVCACITGDARAAQSSYAEIAGAQLILTTPEKWDSITRRWNEQFVLLSSVKLVLVDEVHMIGEADRGGCLESVIGRMKTIQRAAKAKMLAASDIATSSYKNTTPEALSSNMRIVAVSATLPNLGQLASFVESGEAYVFDQSYRPVPLTVYVQACGHIGKNRYLFDKSLNQHVPVVLRQYSNGRPAIVFCHSKKETEQLADELSKNHAHPSRMNEQVLIGYSGRTDLAMLQRCLRRGVAFHHAGLDASDRSLVEEAFGTGKVSCLCATSTLAMGVNLPSHLVVIKGTSAYRGAELGHQDIEAGALMQMMGRAGRPGFDESGTAVIMTDSMSKRRYENVSQGLKVVESHLMDGNKLTEVLNIEISQGVITSVDEAVDWVKGSFLYRRIISHPLHYGLQERGDVHSFVLEKCADSIDKLRKIRAIEMDEDGSFGPAAGCHVMSRNFVTYDTMRAIVGLPHDSGPVQLLRMMSNCEKIQTQVRRNEKKALNEAYKLIKYKLEGPQSKIRIQTPAEKAFVMLQASIGQHHFQDFSLRQQMTNVIDSASQILSAVEQYAKEGSGHGQVATQGMLFRRSLFSSLWGESSGVLNQIGGVTQEMAARLKESGISTFADAANSSEDAIANACNVTPSFASSLRAAASKILQRTLKLSACAKEADGGRLELHVKLEKRVAGASEETGERVVSYSLLIFTDRAGGLLHYSEDITRDCELRVECPEKFGRAYIRLVSNLIGLDEQVTVDGNDKIQKSSFSLSPHVAKSSSTKKGKKQSKISLTQPPPTSRKRTIDAHRDSVSNVNDLRLHKRGKAPIQQNDDDDCVIVDTEAVEFEASSNEQNKATAQKSSRQKMVTPSPHPRTKLTPVRNTASTTAPRSERTNRSNPYNSSARRPNNSSWSKNTVTSRKGPRNSRSSSWFQEKKQQTGAQKTAFHSPKENPFSTYSYDPNNIENSLDSNADRSKIIPDNVSTAALTAKKPRYGHSFRTPANRRKGGAASNRISSVGLLQQKAAELQQHHAQAASASRGYMNRESMPQHNFDAPSARNQGFHSTDGHAVGQYGESFHDQSQLMGMGHMPQGNQITGLESMSQGNHFQRPGTSAGSVMMQQSYGMAGPPSLSPPPPPPFMGRGNNPMIAQNRSLRGPMAGASRPMTSGGRSMASHFQGINVGQISPTGHSGHLQRQPQQEFSHFHLSQNDFQLPSQGFESFHGDPGFPQYGNQLQHGIAFNDPMCNRLDPLHGQRFDEGFGGNVQQEQQISSHFQPHGNFPSGLDDLMPNDMNPQPMQPQLQLRFGGGQQFGGNSSVRNPYAKQTQVSNPYKQQQPQMQMQHPSQQQDFPPPPMQEIICAQSGAGASGLGGDDASQFDDTFL